VRFVAQGYQTKYDQITLGFVLVASEIDGVIDIACAASRGLDPGQASSGVAIDRDAVFDLGVLEDVELATPTTAR
jgi:hypothetical protein